MYEYLKKINRVGTPEHEHDCCHCTFLGHYVDEYGDIGDLYWHGGPGEKTVIHRYGPEGQYASGLNFVGQNSALAIAFARACQLGFVTQEDMKYVLR